MTSEFWKMAATSIKIMNHQKGIFTPKILQVSSGKFISTETLVKMPTNVALNEAPVKVEDRNTQAYYSNGYKSFEDGNIIKGCAQQRKPMYRPKGNKLMSNSKNYTKSLPVTTSGKESQKTTPLPAVFESKRLPVVVSDVGNMFIPHSTERSSVHFRQDKKIGYSEVKNQASNHCSKKYLKKERLFQGIEDIYCRDTSLRHGISVNFSNKRAILKNNVPHPIDIDAFKRKKIIDDITAVHSVERICQKMFNQHQVPHRQMPSVPVSLTYSDNISSVRCKTVVNSMQKDILRSSPSDEIKDQIVNCKEKDKTESSTQKRFLLIDSKGLPYTVVLEEPLSLGLSNSSSSTSTSWSDSTLSSKPLAPRKIYKCPVCFRIFEYLSYLQRHSIAHSQQKPHVCKVCGKAFKRTSHLTRHKYTHFGGKPCQCQICQRRFRNVGELTRHQLTSHTEEENH